MSGKQDVKFLHCCRRRVTGECKALGLQRLKSQWVQGVATQVKSVRKQEEKRIEVIIWGTEPYTWSLHRIGVLNSWPKGDKNIPGIC